MMAAFLVVRGIGVLRSENICALEQDSKAKSNKVVIGLAVNAMHTIAYDLPFIFADLKFAVVKLHVIDKHDSHIIIPHCTVRALQPSIV
jgi:serine kinase of HPr protein (carbohydrate metabolism regulator)